MTVLLSLPNGVNASPMRGCGRNFALLTWNTELPTVGWLAYFKDVDGNIFGVMEMDPSVK